MKPRNHRGTVGVTVRDNNVGRTDTLGWLGISRSCPIMTILRSYLQRRKHRFLDTTRRNCRTVGSDLLVPNADQMRAAQRNTYRHGYDDDRTREITLRVIAADTPGPLSQPHNRLLSVPGGYVGFHGAKGFLREYTTPLLAS